MKLGNCRMAQNVSEIENELTKSHFQDIEF